MCPKSLEPNYARDCINLHNFVSRKHPFLPLNLKHPHHKICLLIDTVSVTCDQENPWDVTNVTAFHTSNGTVNYMSAHCVDRGNVDMPRKIVLTTTMMMELEAILILREGNYSGECWNSDIIYVFILEPDCLIIKILPSFFLFLFPMSICFLLPSLKHLNSFLLLCFSLSTILSLHFLPIPFYHYLITLLQGHTTKHDVTIWLTFTLISDSFLSYLWLISRHDL